MNAGHPIAAHFDELFRADADPWRTRTRWYEQRKRALTLAALPAARYRRAFEPGCAVGELTAALAERCDEVIASDASAAAVARARERLAGAPGVEVVQASVPDDWPAGRFDLIVVSELGYYLEPDALRRFAAACHASLSPNGTLLACHWRHGAHDMRQSAGQVHEALECDGQCERVAHYADADFLLDVWSRDARSVAVREGLA